MSKSLAETNLFKSIKVGDVLLKNRLVYPPTTRYRNTEDFVATDSMLKYYEQRAENNGGLLIAEATFGAPGFGLYANAPMFHTERQVKAWKQIVHAVHQKGSYFSLQVWNLGRVGDAELLKKYNKPLVSASNKYWDEETEKAAKAAGNELRALTVGEIHQMQQEYVTIAKKAIDEANFDFVEIHGAHGYLFDQFIQIGSNDRTDEYGGSIENRARFLLETIDLVIEAVGAEHVAVRLSPYANFQGSEGIEAAVHPIAQFGYILSELEQRAKKGNRLGYISIVEPRAHLGPELEVPPYNTSWIFEIWQGIIMRAGGYLNDEGYTVLKEHVDADDRTLIGASRYFTSNPDLPNRLKNGYPLTPYNREHFYNAFSNVGYLTYGKYGEPVLDEESAIAKQVPQPLA